MRVGEVPPICYTFIQQSPERFSFTVSSLISQVHQGGPVEVQACLRFKGYPSCRWPSMYATLPSKRLKVFNWFHGQSSPLRSSGWC